MPRQQHRGLDLHQPRRHIQELGRHVEVVLLHALDVLHILLQHLGDRDVVNIQFVFLHEVQQQIERPLKDGQLIGNHIHSITAPAQCGVIPNILSIPPMMVLCRK